MVGTARSRRHGNPVPNPRTNGSGSPAWRTRPVTWRFGHSCVSVQMRKGARFAPRRQRDTIGASRVETTFRDVEQDLVQPAGLRGRVEWWKQTRDPEMVSHILDFSHRVLYAITPGQVAGTLLRSTHALGDVHKSENHPVIRDAYTD